MAGAFERSLVIIVVLVAIDFLVDVVVVAVGVVVVVVVVAAVDAATGCQDVFFGEREALRSTVFYMRGNLYGFTTENLHARWSSFFLSYVLL